MSLNKVMLIGNLGHDPEIRYMPASKGAVANLSIAMNDLFTDRSGNRKEQTDWLTVVAYGKLAEVCHQHLKKGRQVYVEGSIRVREYEPAKGGRFRPPDRGLARPVPRAADCGDNCRECGRPVGGRELRSFSLKADFIGALA